MVGVKTMEFDTLVPSLHIALGFGFRGLGLQYALQLHHWCQGVVPTSEAAVKCCPILVTPFAHVLYKWKEWPKFFVFKFVLTAWLLKEKDVKP